MEPTRIHYRDSEPINCTCRKVHVPKYLTTEDHHVVPQAWQHAWTPPANYSFDNGLPHTKTLWDSRTVELCRTCHGNVHYCLEYMMHQYHDWAITNRPDQRLPEKKVLVKNSGLPKAESDIAYLGMERFVQSQGSLLSLTAAGLWGQI